MKINRYWKYFIIHKLAKDIRTKKYGQKLVTVKDQ